MHHLLAHAAPARISRIRPYRQIFVAKFAPHAEHLDALGLIGLDQEVVSHVAPSFVSPARFRSYFFDIHGPFILSPLTRRSRWSIKDFAHGSAEFPSVSVRARLNLQGATMSNPVRAIPEGYHSVTPYLTCKNTGQ